MRLLIPGTEVFISLKVGHGRHVDLVTLVNKLGVEEMFHLSLNDGSKGLENNPGTASGLQ